MSAPIGGAPQSFHCQDCGAVWYPERVVGMDVGPSVPSAPLPSPGPLAEPAAESVTVPLVNVQVKRSTAGGLLALGAAGMLAYAFWPKAAPSKKR